MSNPTDVVQRLLAATNDHDLEALVDCFAQDYRNETPAHPARGFEGREQVRQNWTAIFGGIPDISARIVSSATEGDRVWSEWDMAGTRRDGVPHHMAGVIIFGVQEDRIATARFYLEPVDTGSNDVTAAVQAAVS